MSKLWFNRRLIWSSSNSRIDFILMVMKRNPKRLLVINLQWFRTDACSELNYDDRSSPHRVVHIRNIFRNYNTAFYDRHHLPLNQIQIENCRIYCRLCCERWTSLMLLHVYRINIHFQQRDFFTNLVLTNTHFSGPGPKQYVSFIAFICFVARCGSEEV